MKDHSTFAHKSCPAIEHEFTHLQRRYIRENTDSLAKIFQPRANIAITQQFRKNGRQIFLVSGGQIMIAMNKLGDIIALIHAMFDQRITGQRTDHKNALDTGFKGWRQFGKGFPVRAGKFNPHRFHKGTRRHRAKAGNDHITGNAFLAIRRIQRQPARLPCLGCVSVQMVSWPLSDASINRF